MGWGKDALEQRQPISQSGQRHNPLKRQVRWVQQTLKHLELIERADRGVWKLTAEGHKKLPLRKINSGHVMLAFSTRLGMALWADCATAFSRLDQPVALCLTSPPYPLAKARGYSNPSEAEYVDFLCTAIEPIVRHLQPGGSIVLNLSNDIFQTGTPARSLYKERLVLALADRLGLHKMDEIPWVNKSKAPSPVQWASIKRVQLNVAWETVLWFTNDPLRVRSDNRRVLEPHSERHLKLLASGGEQRDREFSDGAYRLRAGKSFSNPTAGKIPRNVLEMGHRCASQTEYKKMARAAGLPAHGAPFPLALAEFFIRFLTTEGELVAEPFGGSLTVPVAAEKLGRHWVATDVIWEYLAGGGKRIEQVEDFAWNPEFLRVA
jgi:site-specific DNA-methyltransferase (cytosine-N4-specific)